MHVTYGLIGLKVHAKAALVVREESDGLRRYCHIGTGNYNSKTARIYEDLGLLTCDPAIGSDLTQLFNELTGYGRNIDYQRLLVAPRLLRDGLYDLIQGEIDAASEPPGPGPHHDEDEQPGRPGHDRGAVPGVAGRGRDRPDRARHLLPDPGVPGMSETIRVRSIVGRYLEHSRIYRFANGARPRARVAPHRVGRPDAPQPRPPGRGADPGHRRGPAGPPRRGARPRAARRRAGLDTRSDGRWTRSPEGGTVESQVALQELTIERAAQPIAPSVV